MIITPRTAGQIATPRRWPAATQTTQGTQATQGMQGMQGTTSMQGTTRRRSVAGSGSHC